MWKDLRFAARRFRRSPVFYGMAALTLALGVGASASVFGVVRAVLLRPLPFHDPSRVVVAWTSDTASREVVGEISYAQFLDRQRDATTFERMAVMPTTVYGYGMALTGLGDPTQIESARVSGDFFNVFGTAPALGRTLLPEDDRVGAARTVVLTHRLWTDRFGADPSIVGTAVTLNGTATTVVGVMPPEFDFPKGVDAWAPLASSMNQRTIENRRAVFLQIVGRLKPGVTPEQARVELGELARAEEPPDVAARMSAVVTPIDEYIVGRTEPVLLTLLAASSLLALVASANVAGLLLSRAGGRQQEIAVRAALGASRGRLVRQLATESLVLACLGGAGGVAIAYLALWALPFVAPRGVPRLESATVDASVLLFALGTVAIAALVSGLVPAVHATRDAISSAIRVSSGTLTRSRAQRALGRTLVSAQVAATLVLMVGGVLLARSAYNLSRAPIGFSAENVLTAEVTLSWARHSTHERRRELFRSIVERLEAEPGVLGAGFVLVRPLQGTIGWDTPMTIEGQTPEEARANPVPNFEVVTPGYFAAMGIPRLGGRDFAEDDAEEHPQVAVVSASTAARFWPGRDAVGQRIKLDDAPDEPWTTVVGVVGDVRYRALDTERLDLYVPYTQSNAPIRYIVVRTASSPRDAVATLRRVVAEADPDQPVTSVATMQELVSAALAGPRFSALLLTLLSALALVLACVGLYGVISESVAQRRREIGVRVALGARPSQIVRLVVGDGVVPVAAGVLVGLVVALACAATLAPPLYGVSATDPTVFGAVAALLAAVALVASGAPARRATTVDPVEVLRGE